MMNTQISDLNDEFGIEGAVEFAEGPNGLAIANITSNSGKASIALNGGTVLSFAPNGEEDVLWVSSESAFEEGKAIRGGIPVCWPWFGSHPTDASKPSHGFARYSAWRVAYTDALDDGTVAIRLEMAVSDEMNTLFPYPFSLYLDVCVGKTLMVNLITRNTGTETFQITDALHSYFSIGDISQVTVSGLESTQYLDKLEKFRQKGQDGLISFNKEVDRVYIDTKSDCIIDDAAKKRKIRISKTGSSSTVVWNPWIETAAAMGNLGDNEYLEFLCVETTNAGTDIIEIKPGDRHVLSAVTGLE